MPSTRISTTRSLLAGASTVALLLGSATAQNYSLSQDYSGKKFFDGFSFDAIPDPTNGLVQYVDVATANSSRMAGFLASNGSKPQVYLSAGPGVMVGPQNGRQSIRVSSQATFNHALVVADIAHMPSGFAMWPAFWMLGAGTWPNGGEIDIVEGVNDQSFNKMTLHTTAGVKIQNDTSALTGTIFTGDCDVNAQGQDKNQGCQVIDSSSTPSFGEPFNKNGGGVFATEWTSHFIKIWFFPRNKIPKEALSSSPDPSTWGKPNALFQPTQDGIIDQHFKDLQIIINLTFCGDWAGKAWSECPACMAQASTCEAYVAKNPDAFQNAYWAFNSLQVFQH